MKRIKSALIYGGYALGYLLAWCAGLLARRLPRYKKLWLISERKTDARDNGLHFFRYLTREHPEINAAFLIDRDSPDYGRVRELGRVIQPWTAEHFLAFACAQVHVSTHYMGCAPDMYRFRRLNELRLIRGKQAVIRHGISAADAPELHCPPAHLDLYVCSAVPEYQDALRRYGHPEGVVRKLGLCRYDRLLQAPAPKRQILVMPTWRMFLHKLSDEAFQASDYYRTYTALLNDPSLLAALEEWDYQLVFYLHYMLQPYTRLFSSGHPRVAVRGLGDADVQELLMESAMLITDYSSVFFDFAYMGKPLACLQFDEELFFRTQYRRGYFDFRRDGFGPVFRRPEEVSGYIRACLERGMEPEAQYRARAEQFFGERGTDHCAKTFQAIEGLL